MNFPKYHFNMKKEQLIKYLTVKQEKALSEKDNKKAMKFGKKKGKLRIKLFVKKDVVKH